MTQVGEPEAVSADPFNFFESVLARAATMADAEHVAIIAAIGDLPARRRDLIDVVAAQSEITFSIGKALLALAAEEEGGRNKAMSHLEEALMGQLRFAQEFQSRLTVGSKNAVRRGEQEGDADA